MARFTKAIRERIVREFTTRHNGQFDPGLFLSEVEAAGEAHEAHAWFEWDEAAAARQYQVEQARAFARGITVSFTVEEVGRNKVVSIREVDAPLMVSAMATRRHGGGYFTVEPDNPAHMAELCAQAARDLDAWLRRYRGALLFAGGSTAMIERQMKALVSAAPEIEEAA